MQLNTVQRRVCLAAVCGVGLRALWSVYSADRHYNQHKTAGGVDHESREGPPVMQTQYNSTTAV